MPYSHIDSFEQVPETVSTEYAAATQNVTQQRKVIKLDSIDKRNRQISQNRQII